MKRGVLLAVALALAGGAAAAHSWYDAECCSDRDCFHRRGLDEVTGAPARGGFLLRWRGREWLFDEHQVRRSADGLYHICLAEGAERPRCAYVPDAGV